MTTNRYKPLFPRCVDGSDYRHPIKDEAVEAVALRMDEIYSTADLSNVARANLLDLYHALRMTMSHVHNGPKLVDVTRRFEEFNRLNGLSTQEGDYI